MADVATMTEEASGEPRNLLVVSSENLPPGNAPHGGFEALESRALRATMWTVISYGAAQCLRVVNSMVLTRLLMPQAFGEMTLVITLIVGMTMLSDIGLEPSVIQSADRKSVV